jgi:hypothetical protein
MVLKPENLIVQRCRSKVFSPACLFRFSESSAPYPIATQPLKGRGKVQLIVKIYSAFVLVEPLILVPYFLRINSASTSFPKVS